METNKPQDLRITETQGDTIEIFLCPNKHPVAYQRKLWELVNQGMTRHEAETILLRPLQLELFYDIDTGLFAVEAEATECCEIYNPYSSRIIPNDNLPEKPEPTTPKIIDTSIGELNYVRDELQNAGYNNNPLQVDEIIENALSHIDDALDTLHEFSSELMEQEDDIDDKENDEI